VNAWETRIWRWQEWATAALVPHFAAAALLAVNFRHHCSARKPASLKHQHSLTEMRLDAVVVV
jgi:hypothetical protein